MSSMRNKQTVSLVIIIAITIFIGMRIEAHITYGYIDPQRYTSDPDLVNNITQVNYWETLVNYCFNHADRPNPLQDLRDKGFSVIGSDCKQVKLLYDEQLNSVNKMIANYSPNFCDLIDPIERQNYPNCRGK